MASCRITESLEDQTQLYKEFMGNKDFQKFLIEKLFELLSQDPGGAGV